MLNEHFHQLIGLLGQRVELGNGVVECLLGEVASAIGAVQDLVAVPFVSIIE